MDQNIIEEYMEKGEEWENDPQAYVEAFAGRRGEYKAALEELDASEMVAMWSDRTLFDVCISGSDLGFDKTTRKKVNDAAKAERDWRNPAVVPDGNGMGEDGGQKVEEGE